MAKPNRKQQIVSALITLVASKGYSGCSMADIGDRVGFRASANYKHFKGKPEIHKVACEQIAVKMDRSVEDCRFMAQSYFSGGVALNNLNETLPNFKSDMRSALDRIVL